MGGRMSSKMTGTGRRGKKQGTLKRTIRGASKQLPFAVQNALKKRSAWGLIGAKSTRKNKIDIKETGLK